MPIGLTDLTIRMQGKPILCLKCNRGGGTLVKVEGGYVHDPKCPAQPVRRVRLLPVSKEELARLQGK